MKFINYLLIILLVGCIYEKFTIFLSDLTRKQSQDVSEIADLNSEVSRLSDKLNEIQNRTDECISVSYEIKSDIDDLSDDVNDLSFRVSMVSRY